MALGKRRKRKPRRTFACPNCGEEVRAGALACPECGSDASTGWSEDTLYDGLDLPDPGYGPESPPRPRSRVPWTAIWIAMILLFVLAFVLR